MAGPPLHLTPGSKLWPPELLDLEGAPRELWLRGRVEWLGRGPRLAVVGSRSPTPYGLDQARRFARAFAEAGCVVVSGLARGIDQAAHEGALEAGGGTLAVLGSGVDRPWPEGATTRRVAAEGLLLSEFAPGRSARRHHFPMRNRLISGLSRAVVVIEAAQASGSLITARWAADQGREVFALPGRVDHPMARGCHRLLREGAGLVEGPREVLGELGLAAEVDPTDATPADAAHGNPATARPRGELAAAVLACLRGETLRADEVAERTGRGLQGILTTLVELELEGAVVRGPGGLHRIAAQR